jgi:hypothetical protein
MRSDKPEDELFPTIEQTKRNGAIDKQFLVNHCAFSRLEPLASELFYGGVMRSDKIDDEISPLSVRKRPAWLEGLMEAEHQPIAERMSLHLW